MLCNSQGTTTDVPGGLEAEPRSMQPSSAGIPAAFLECLQRQSGPATFTAAHPQALWLASLARGPRLKFAINEKSSGFSRKRPRDRRCLSQLRLQVNVTKTSPWAWLQTEQVSSRDTQACAPAIHTCHTPHPYISLSLSL